MHMHGIQPNLSLQMNPAFAARAEARREAERTRAKLRSEASSLANEVDEEGFIVSLSERGDSRQQSNREGAEKQNGEKQQGEQPTAATAEEAFSDYA